jgi:hypothetical protein
MSEADASIIVGKPVLLVGYDEDGRAELHFDDAFDTRTDDYSALSLDPTTALRDV